MINYTLTRNLLRGLTEDELVDVHHEATILLRNIYQQRATPLTEVEKELVKGGEYIAAIKAYRERNRVGLAEAKGAVDVYRDAHLKEKEMK